MPAADEGTTVCACVRGMYGGTWAAAVALARVVGWPRGPRDDRPAAVLVVGPISTPFEPSCGSEAAPGGPGVSWGWLAATPRPSGASVADVVDDLVPLWRCVVRMNLFRDFGD